MYCFSLWKMAFNEATDTGYFQDLDDYVFH